MNKWTLISEKKPEPETPVNVYDMSNDKYYVDELDHNGVWYGKGSFCDAWRPIEPYKEGGQE